MNQGKWIVNGTTTGVNPASATSATTSQASAATAAVPPSSLETSASSSKSGSGSETALGVGLGLGAGTVIGLGIVAILTLWNRRRRKDEIVQRAKELAEGDLKIYPMPLSESGGAARIEAAGKEKPAELWDDRLSGSKSQELQGYIVEHELG